MYISQYRNHNILLNTLACTRGANGAGGYWWYTKILLKFWIKMHSINHIILILRQLLYNVIKTFIPLTNYCSNFSLKSCMYCRLFTYIAADFMFIGGCKEKREENIIKKRNIQRSGYVHKKFNNA